MFLNSLLADPAKWYPLLFDTPLNAVRSVAIWLTLALLVAFIVCAALLKGEKRALPQNRPHLGRRLRLSARRGVSRSFLRGGRN